MTLTQGQRVHYLPLGRPGVKPVGAVVVRDDVRPDYIVIRKDTFPNPICVKRTSVKVEAA